MSLFGNTKVRECIIGNIHLLKRIPGYSAYEIAVKHGFKGTEEEWLASLKGKDGEKGDKGDPGTIEISGEFDALNKNIINVADPVEGGDAINKKYADEKYVNGDAFDEFTTAANDRAKNIEDSIAIEDISDKFINDNYGNTISGLKAYKQGKVIFGQVGIEGNFSGTEPLFKVNADYSPVCDALFTAFAYSGETESYTDYYTAYLSKTIRSFGIQNANADVNGYLLCFTYMCE